MSLFDGVGERVRFERVMHGMSQRDLAKAAKVSSSSVYEIENSRRQPNPSTLRKIADALGIEIRELFPDKN